MLTITSRASLTHSEWDIDNCAERVVPEVFRKKIRACGSSAAQFIERSRASGLKARENADEDVSNGGTSSQQRSRPSMIVWVRIGASESQGKRQ